MFAAGLIARASIAILEFFSHTRRTANVGSLYQASRSIHRLIGKAYRLVTRSKVYLQINGRLKVSFCRCMARGVTNVRDLSRMSIMMTLVAAFLFSGSAVDILACQKD